MFPVDSLADWSSNSPFKARTTFLAALGFVLTFVVYEFLFVQLSLDGWTKTVSIGVHEGYLYRNATWNYDIGKWLDSCQSRSPSLHVTEKLHGNPCPNDCSGNGVCNSEFGECRCRMGYAGTNCSELEVHPCNLPPTDGLPSGPWLVSSCSAQCDERTSKCRCGPDSKFPGRYVRDFCGFLGGPRYTGIVDPEILYSTNASRIGWCNAVFNHEDKFEHLRDCFCSQDGKLGRFCEVSTLAYCINGCHGHGVCESGYCRCHHGWYGIDCSIPSVTSLNDINLPLWLSERKENSKAMKTLNVKRRRPLIYVYDLPGELNFHLLERRGMRYACVPWFYGYGNETVFFRANYAMELAVYEAVLSSPHRTMNAELADYFFVPVLGGCVAPQFMLAPDFGFDPKYMGNRQYLTSEYYLKAYEYIKDQYPYWNKTNGRDHVWVFPWDEGSCIAPAKIWNSIMITSFGNTMIDHSKSTSSFMYDNWDSIPSDLRGNHSCYDPDKDIILPAWKDPNPKIVDLRLWERSFDERNTLFYFTGNLGANYTGGRIEPGYSMGIRQKVAYYFASVPDIHGNLGIKAQQNVTVKFENTPDYITELANSKFCGVFPGDGFSSKMEDAILSGCIPVIIQDGIHVAFENFLNVQDFTVRLKESEIPDMISTLESISESAVKSMMNIIKHLWLRYTYLSVIQREAKRQYQQFGYVHEWAKAYNQLHGDDAIDTMFQILDYKRNHDAWRREARNTSSSSSNHLDIDKCMI